MNSITKGVKGVLSLDPDLVMLGEFRDGPSAHAAVGGRMVRGFFSSEA